MSEQGNSDNTLLLKALECRGAGNFEEALNLLNGLVLRHDAHARLQFLAGSVALEAREVDKAVIFLKRSLELAPDQPDALCHLGVAYWQLQDYQNAEIAYQKAISLDKNYAEAYNNLCMVVHESHKRPLDALSLVDQAITLRPDYADAYNNRGNILQALDRVEEALISYNKSLALNSKSAFAHNNRGNALRKLGRLSDSLFAYQEAIRLNPNYAEAFCNMGCALADLGQIEDARRFYLHSLLLYPNFFKSNYNLGSLEAAAGNHELALKSYDKAISLSPQFADAYWNKSLLLLLLGNYEEGFKLYEWGWKNGIRGQHRGFTQPVWLGKEPILGKTLLIYQEQGIGDCIHYARYVSNAVSMGANVILENVGPLIPLLKSMKIPCQFVKLGDPLPEFDIQIPLMSLPLAFGTKLDHLDKCVPYLFADKEKVLYWEMLLSSKTKPRVGVVWSGSSLHKNDRNRSLDVKSLLPLFSLPLEFHCLQKEIRKDDAVCLSALPMIHTHSDKLNDFSDTAALIHHMDIVISVDTSVAHLAGAMGKPTWVMLPSAPDWRWLLGREDSPWYPSVRLFRQPDPGNWDYVVTAIRSALQLQFSTKGMIP